MKAISKLRPPHSSADRPLQEVRGSFRFADVPTIQVRYFPSLRCFRKWAKIWFICAESLIFNFVAALPLYCDIFTCTPPSWTVSENSLYTCRSRCCRIMLYQSHMHYALFTVLVPSFNTGPWYEAIFTTVSEPAESR